MGSSDKSQQELIVIVTGFGPFKDDFPRNPSWDIAAKLPPYLPNIHPKAPASVREASATLPPVRIVVHPEPVRVTYDAARQIVSRLWDPAFSGVPRVDLVLHIGMASTRPQYVLETLGHRDNYKLGDLDSALPLQDPSSTEWPWHGVPSQLTTDLDVEDILKRWKAHLPDNPFTLKLSTDAGHFLCDYIYFNSLATCFNASQRRRVAFLHVPAAKPDPEQEYDEGVTIGQKIALQLIRSMVESEWARGELT